MFKLIFDLFTIQHPSLWEGLGRLDIFRMRLHHRLACLYLDGDCREVYILGIVDISTFFCNEERVLHYHVLDRHFGQTIEIDSSISALTYYIVKEYILETWSLFCDRRNGIVCGSVLVCLASNRLVGIVEAETEGFTNYVVHTDIVKEYVPDKSATASG